MAKSGFELKKLYTIRSLLLLCCLLFSCIVAFASIKRESKVYNRKGSKLYEAEKYAKASQAFMQAIKADATNYIAHYNLAASLCQFRRRQNICGEIKADKKTILYHLQQSIQLSPKRIRRMRNDENFNVLRNTFKYYMIEGYSIKKPDDLAYVIPKVRWTVCYAHEKCRIPQGHIYFYTNTEFRFEFKKYQGEGTLEFGNKTMILKFKEGNFPEKKISCVINEEGEISFTLGDDKLFLFNNIDECAT